MRQTLDLELDRALESGRPADDPTVADLSDFASQMRLAFAAEPPPARGERALFTTGAGALRHRPARVLRSAMAAAALLVTLGWLGSDALPGDTLYPVRQVLGKVGLAPSALEEIDERIGAARDKVKSAESALKDQPALAERLARAAINDLNDARRLLGEVGEPSRQAALIAGLELRAARVIERALGALGTEDLPGAAVEDKGETEEGRRRSSQSDDEGNSDDRGDDDVIAGGNGTNRGNNTGSDGGDDGPDADEDDANQGQDKDDATDDDKGGGVTAGSDQDRDDPDEPEPGDADGNQNDPQNDNDPEDIDSSDADVAEAEENAD
jgi:hypothetical protein